MRRLWSPSPDMLDRRSLQVQDESVLLVGVTVVPGTKYWRWPLSLSVISGHGAGRTYPTPAGGVVRNQEISLGGPHLGQATLFSWSSLPATLLTKISVLQSIVRRPATAAETLRFRSETRHEHGYERAAELIDENWEQMVSFYRFPRGHWRHLRTSNVVESPFAALRLRTGRGQAVQEGSQCYRCGMEDAVGRRTQVPAHQLARATAGRRRRAALSRRPTDQRRPTPGGRRLICLHTD